MSEDRVTTAELLTVALAMAPIGTVHAERVLNDALKDATVIGGPYFVDIIDTSDSTTDPSDPDCNFIMNQGGQWSVHKQGVIGNVT